MKGAAKCTRLSQTLIVWAKSSSILSHVYTASGACIVYCLLQRPKTQRALQYNERITDNNLATSTRNLHCSDGRSDYTSQVTQVPFSGRLVNSFPRLPPVYCR